MTYRLFEYIKKKNVSVNFLTIKNTTCIGILVMFQRHHAAAVAQWVRAFALQAKGWVFQSQPWKTEVIKTGSDLSTAKRLAIGVSVMGPRSIGQNLQPFTSNGDVSIWVKNSRVKRKTPNKQTCCWLNCTICSENISYLF